MLSRNSMLLWWILWSTRESRLLSGLWASLQRTRRISRASRAMLQRWNLHWLPRHSEDQLQRMVRLFSTQLNFHQLKICHIVWYRQHSKCGHGSRLECETDACLIDDQVIDGIKRDASRLGWKPANYSKFYGRKLSEGLRYRLGTFEPRLPVKGMTKILPGVDYFPKTFNSLFEWSGLISEIRDQSWCG